MSELLFFIIGLLIGRLFGIGAMCLLQINNLRREEDEKK